MILDKFETEYKKLNSNQKKAVDTVEGTVMVIAGPGTGKTQILSLRIANILKQTDTNPENILALTFTNAGVFSMRKRLVDIIGPEAYRVNIFTFHGFCESLVSEYGEEFEKLADSRLVTPIEQLQIVEEIIEKGKFDKLKPWGKSSTYVNSLPKVIGELKREAVFVKDFQQIIVKQAEDFKQIDDLYYIEGRWKGQMKGMYKKVEKNIKKNEEVAKFYEIYQKKLAEEKLYDYDDVILETVATLTSNSDFLLALQEKYQYILVDEHQDTNRSQNKILELLTNYFERPNFFIVGDEKQAIYRFQGASLENFLLFKNKYKDVLTINLLDNYRSTQKILDGAHSLIEKNPLSSQGQNLEAKRGGKGTKISLYGFSENEFERLFLVKDIKEKIRAGINLNEIAVFYRNNKEVPALMKILEKAKIPFVVESKQDILSDLSILKIVLLLKTINNLGDNSLLGETLFIDFLELDSLDIYKLLAYSKTSKQDLFACLKSEQCLETAEIVDKNKMLQFYQRLNDWKKSAMNKGLVDCLEEVVYQSNYFDALLRSVDSADKLHKLNKLFDEAKKLVALKPNAKLVDFINHLEMLENYNLTLKNRGNDLLEGVRLMTAHGAKGLEFDIVYIINVIDKHWGNQISKNKFNLPIYQSQDEQNNEDERRLFFVALTRARKEVNISYAKKNVEGRDQMPSQFLNEIDSQFIEEKDAGQLEKTFLQNRQVLVQLPQRKQANLKSKIYLNKLFLRTGLNATAVNNYLRCPWSYFFKNLLKIPLAYSKPMIYGNVIHQTLERFFKKINQGETVSQKNLLDIFAENIQKSSLLQADKEEALKKGQVDLAGYYEAYQQTWQKNTLLEFGVQGVSLKIDENQEVPLTGKLDKIELSATGKEVKVVDYKTGKPKSKNEIEGKTKNSTGDYKRQLVFYKLLLDKYNNGQYRMTTGEIDFITPKDNGEYQKVALEITNNDVKNLEKTIRGISQEILDLGFWGKKCDDENCWFCKLRQIMEM